jgi:hypothetical protein
MYFSNSIIASALLGLVVATTHMGEAAPGGLATSSTSAIAASETLASSSAGSAGSVASSMPASAGTLATHVIQVGGPNGSLTFSPENVKAAPGDLIQFQFHPKVCSSGLYYEIVALTSCPEPLRSPVYLRQAVRTDSECHAQHDYRLFLWIHADQRFRRSNFPGPHLHDPRHGHKAHMVLLLASEALPRWHGRCYQRVSVLDLCSKSHVTNALVVLSRVTRPCLCSSRSLPAQPRISVLDKPPALELKQVPEPARTPVATPLSLRPQQAVLVVLVVPTVPAVPAAQVQAQELRAPIQAHQPSKPPTLHPARSVHNRSLVLPWELLRLSWFCREVSSTTGRYQGVIPRGDDARLRYHCCFC